MTNSFINTALYGGDHHESEKVMKTLSIDQQKKFMELSVYGIERILDGKPAPKPAKALDSLFDSLLSNVPVNYKDRFLRNLNEKRISDKEACWTYKTLIDSSLKLSRKTRIDLYRSIFAVRSS